MTYAEEEALEVEIAEWKHETVFGRLANRGFDGASLVQCRLPGA